MSAEITAFSDRYAEFEKLDTEVIGVSTDSVVMIPTNSTSLYVVRSEWLCKSVLLIFPGVSL